MTDHAAPFQPGREQKTMPSRSRSWFAGYKAFGSGDGAVLMDIGIERRLRSAARSATQERRVAGGLLFGRGWTDDQGSYLVIDGFLEAGAGEDRGDRVAVGGAGQFTLSEADLRLQREDAARVYPASLEVGWWRTLAALGEFSPRDFMTQAELVGPDGVGLLVYGSGVHWGTAYLGPNGISPDTAGTLVRTADGFPAPPPEQEPTAEPRPELVDITAGEHLTQKPVPVADAVTEVKSTGLTDAAAGRPLQQQAERRRSGRARRPAPAPVPEKAVGGAPGRPEVPEDVRLVVAALAVTAVAAAIIVGILLHSLTATVIIAAIVLLVIFSSVWLSRR
jgi:hypothetical protein